MEEWNDPFAMPDDFVWTPNCEESKKKEEKENSRELVFTDVYTWGMSNLTGHGSLSESTTVIQPRALRCLSLERIVQICVSNTFTLARSADGRVFSWGLACPTPKVVDGLSNISFIAVTKSGCGYLSYIDSSQGHSVAIDDSGKVWTWGVNECGQLGTDNKQNYSKPQEINLPEPMAQASCGDTHTLLLSKSGAVYISGSYLQSQVLNFQSIWKFPTRIIQVDSGSEWFAALSEEGNMYTWGDCTSSVSSVDYFGHQDSVYGAKKDVPQPSLVWGLRNKVRYMKLGWIHAGAVTFDGQTYTWGEGDTYRLGHGECGYGSSRHIPQPCLVKALADQDVVQLSFSRGNEAALTRDGEVFVWGGSEHGGHHNCDSPTALKLAFEYEFSRGGKVAQISCGKYNSGLITATKMTLVTICIRSICHNLSYYSKEQLVLPYDVKELMYLYLKSRVDMTGEIVDKLGISF